MRVLCKCAVVVLIIGACTPTKSTPVGRALAEEAGVGVVDAAAPPEAAAAPAPQELTGYPVQMDLLEADAGKTKLGVVGVPIGAREPRPLMIALHGGSDHPEWACNAWRGITNSYPFLVCPRGIGMEAALAWSTPAETKARILRAVAATRQIFGTWVRDDAAIVLVGFSMGATQTAYLAQSEPMRYRRVALAESAYAPDPAMQFAAPWVKGGGERAIFLCTTLGCEATYRKAARNVAAQHVPTRLNIAGTTEHGMWDQVVRSMRRDWPWLIEGLDGWKGYVPPEEADLPGRTEKLE
jgi:pimeloyl-ACP methyl ester carboxylesterase